MTPRIRLKQNNVSFQFAVISVIIKDYKKGDKEKDGALEVRQDGKLRRKGETQGSFPHSYRTPRKPGARTGGSTLRAAGGATTRRGSRGSSPRG